MTFSKIARSTSGLVAPQNERLIMRERTQNIRLETSYCRSCKCNTFRNIGALVCVNCGNEK